MSAFLRALEPWQLLAGGMALGAGAAMIFGASPPAEDDDEEDREAPSTEPMTFTYFPVMAKGLGPAAILELSGLPWRGPRETGFAMADWAALKQSGKTPFGQLPLLEVDGMNIGQCTAIINYVGQKCGSEGKDPAEFAMSQMLIAEAEDIYAALQKAVPTKFAKLGERGKGGIKQYQQFWEETLPGHLSKLDALLSKNARGKRFTKSGTTVGEVYLWAFLHQAVLVTPSCLDAAAGIKAFYKSITALPAVAKVLSGQSSMGQFMPYFRAPEPGEGFEE